MSPKPKKMSKRKAERRLYAMCYDYMMSTSCLGKAMEMAGVDVNQRRKEDLEPMSLCRNADKIMILGGEIYGY